jgi:hypothetical protein
MKVYDIRKIQLSDVSLDGRNIKHMYVIIMDEAPNSVLFL